MLVLNPADRATINELLQDEFLNGGGIPESLPLSALACPPSQTFLEQVKKVNVLSRSKRQESEFPIQSSRTSKSSLLKDKQLACDKFGSTRRLSRQGKTERTQGSIVRVASAATMAANKEVHLQNGESRSPTYVRFFEEQPKYGMFYILSSNCVGMRFNDQTSLTCNQKLTKYKYLVMQNNAETSSETFDQSRYPEHLQKKIKIIHHF